MKKIKVFLVILVLALVVVFANSFYMSSRTVWKADNPTFCSDCFTGGEVIGYGFPLEVKTLHKTYGGFAGIAEKTQYNYTNIILSIIIYAAAISVVYALFGYIKKD